jgi:hypothetical protein
MTNATRTHRAETFARRDHGDTITVRDLLDADARDDADHPAESLARLHELADRLTATTGAEHHVWLVPALGLRPATYQVLPAVYTGRGWVKA